MYNRLHTNTQRLTMSHLIINGIVDNELVVWVNHDGMADRFNSIDEIPCEYDSMEINYITLNANSELVVETI